jgi:cell fate regulator YaaT (PSP1 superfamily)
MTEPGYNVHDWVIFEGDRGMEIGQITAVDVDPLPLDKALPAIERLPRIVRRASLEEAEEYKRRDEKDEKQVLEFIREELLRLRLASLHITKCSFQWDKVRLTVFFDTPKRKFFVPLLKALNRKYNCRIWMYHVNKSKGAPNENPGVACSSQSE